MHGRQWLTALEATRNFRKYNPLEPELAKYEWSLLITLGNLDESAIILEEYSQKKALTSSLYNCYLSSLHASSQTSLKQILKAHSDYAEQYFADNQPSFKSTNGAPQRVGLLSGEMREHSAAKFLVPLIEALTSIDIELIAFSTSKIEDERSNTIKGLCSQWHSLARASTSQAIDTISAHKPDQLLNCDWLLQHSRLDIAEKLPASIPQVDYLQAGPTGIPQIPFRLTDPHIDPPKEDGDWLGQKNIYLAGGAHAFEKPLNAVEPAIERKYDGSLLIGSFNHICKINDHVLQCWTKILKQCGQAKLLLKAGQLDLPEMQVHLKKRLKRVGISEDRVLLLGFAPNPDLHFKLYNRLSIALDTFPYNGVTTTCEALWMGTPVVTLPGNRPIARKGVSLLHQIGASELVVESEDAYINKVVALIEDQAQRKYYHQNLRIQMAQSPLCSIERMANDLKNAL